MKIFEGLVQGSPEWLAVRAQHFCASDAPAVMGVSKYKTRGDFLREKATGHTPEVGPAKQALFNRGHAAEEAARPLVEEDLDEELYPCVGALDVDGMAMLASFDGQTMTGDIIWECKLWNESLAASVRAGELEPHYWAQLEHSLLVSGADRAYFTTTDGTREKFAGTWYEAVPERRAQLIAAWRQFAADLATYQHDEVQPAAVATEQPSLPAVIVNMGGALTVSSNLPDFGVALRSYIKTIPAKPATDQEFADAELACKNLKKAEEALQAAEDRALAGMTDVEAMRRVVADLCALARTTRLASEKMVEARKIAIRDEIRVEFSKQAADHLINLNLRIGKEYMPSVPVDFAACMLRKKTITSLRDACSQVLTDFKIKASAIADGIQVNMRYAQENASEYGFLFADFKSIVLKATDDFQSTLTSRIATHKLDEARKDQERKDREAAEAKRVEDERIAREAADAIAKAATPAAAAPVAPAAVVTAAPVTVGRRYVSAAPASPSQPAAAPAAQPTLRLEVICDWLGFIINAALVEQIGVEPASRDTRQLPLFHEHQFTDICKALIQHIESVAEMAPA